MENLAHAYDDIVARMQGADYIELKVEDIAAPAINYSTDRLLIKKREHCWSGYRLDQLVFIAKGHLLRRLAVVMAAALIHDNKRDPLIKIDLTNPESDIKALFIDARFMKSFRLEAFEGSRQFERLCWGYREANRHPWRNGTLPDNLYHLPHFALTDQADGGDFVMNYDGRHFVIIGGWLESFDRLINLLLNISDDRSEEKEFVLEAEPGFRGVAPASAEASFGLPGSIWWDCFGRNVEGGEAGA